MDPHGPFLGDPYEMNTFGILKIRPLMAKKIIPPPLNPVAELEVKKHLVGPPTKSLHVPDISPHVYKYYIPISYESTNKLHQHMRHP